MKNITYHIPHLGKASLTLYTISSSTYRLLEEQKHMSRMRKTPQLGVMKQVYEGAHHTRLDYVILQLYLADCLYRETKESGLGLGLSNDLSIGDSSVSGVDILQVWVLALNAGHLFGTFATEKALLEEIRNSNTLRNTLLNGLPTDPDIHRLSRELINNNDIFRIHEVLAFYFINRIKKNEKNIVIDILKYFRALLPEEQDKTDRILRLRKFFRKIRLLSYLFLDTHYGPVPLKLELSEILFNFKDHIIEIFINNDSPLNRELSSFQSMLSESFYMSPLSMCALGQHVKEVKKLITQRKLKQSSSRRILTQFLKSTNDLDIELRQINSDILGGWISHRHAMFPCIAKLDLQSIETSWNSKASRYYTCTVLTDPQKMSLSISIEFNPRMQPISKFRSYFKVVQHVFDLQNKIRSYQGIWNPRVGSKALLLRASRLEFENICKQLLLFILKKAFTPGIVIEPRGHTAYNDLWFIERTATKTTEILEDFSKMLTKIDISKQRTHEIDTLAKQVKNTKFRGKILTTTSQILLKQQDGTVITELDGVAILQDSSRFTLLIVEAKKRMKRVMSEAKKDLRLVMTQLNMPHININPEVSIIGIPRHGAYFEIPLIS